MSKYDVQNLRVRLGDHNIKDNDSQTVVKHVKRVIRHNGFSSSTLVSKTSQLKAIGWHENARKLDQRMFMVARKC